MGFYRNSLCSNAFYLCMYSIFLTLKDKEEFDNIENDFPYIKNHFRCILRNATVAC